MSPKIQQHIISRFNALSESDRTKVRELAIEHLKNEGFERASISEVDAAIIYLYDVGEWDIEVIPATAKAS